MKTNDKWFLFFLLTLLPVVAYCQESGPKVKLAADTLVVAKDSTWHVDLNAVDIFPDKRDLPPREAYKLSLLEAKVKKVYPIAKVAAFRLAEYNRVYTSFKTDKERKQYVKEVEKQLFNEYEEEMRTMKVSEGRILIKLLDRQTGNSSFEIIKEFKGGFAAFFWQSVARLFGHDLKAQYDAKGEDRQIENVIIMIELGMI